MAVFHTILHPTDFDHQSIKAFRVARALAQQLGAKVIAFHVAPPPAVVTADGRVIVDPKDPTPVDLWTDYRAAQSDTPNVFRISFIMEAMLLAGRSAPGPRRRRKPEKRC